MAAQRKRITDTTKGHTWDFTVLDAHTLHLVETAVVDKPSVYPDASNELWVFAVLRIDGTGATFKMGDKTLGVPAGTYGFFKPSFTITEIGMDHGTVAFDAILSERPLPAGCPDIPLLLDVPQDVLPGGYDELFGVLGSAPVRSAVPREGTDVPGIALRIKERIQECYRIPISFSEIADDVGISRNLLSMYFKRAFCMTPSEYRKQLRIKASVFKLLDCAETGEGIADIAFDCGYGDLSRYNKQFKAFTGVTPRQVKTYSANSIRCSASDRAQLTTFRQ